MSNKELNTPANNGPKNYNSWDWIWPTIVAVIIVELFGLVGGLVTVGAYYGPFDS